VAIERVLAAAPGAAVVPSAPEARTARLFTDAERAARSITAKDLKAAALHDIAQALAATSS
jgi:hypothetical protein